MRLSDTERKLLRILFHCYGMMPARVDMRRLERLAQRTEKQIVAALRQLAEERYITLEDGIVRVVVPEERQLRWVSMD